jgi:hypothetical protein
MKTRSKFVMSMVTALMLLTMLLGVGPVDQVKAEAAESLLAAAARFKSCGSFLFIFRVTEL